MEKLRLVGLLVALLCVASPTHADRRVGKETTFHFDPPKDAGFPITFTPRSAKLQLHLELGDRVVFKKVEQLSLVTFTHKCFKSGLSVLGVTIVRSKTARKQETFQFEIVAKFEFTVDPNGKAAAKLEVAPPMTYVAITDGFLAAAASEYNKPKYNEYKQRKPCPQGFEHKDVSESAASPFAISVIVCRSGIAGDDVECN